MGGGDGVRSGLFVPELPGSENPIQWLFRGTPQLSLLLTASLVVGGN